MINEEITKSKKVHKIRPTEKIKFIHKDIKRINKNHLFSNAILKHSFEQRKDNIVMEKTLNKNNSEMNIKKFNTSLYKRQIKEFYKYRMMFKKLIETPKEKENSSTSKIFNESFNISHFLNNISILKRYRNINKKTAENSLCLSQTNNAKKKEVKIKKITFIPKTLKDFCLDNKRKQIKLNKININFNVKNEEDEENQIKSNINKMADINSYNLLNSLDNDSTNLNDKNNSITKLKFSSLQNKLKYLFGDLAEKKLNNTCRKKTKINFKSYYRSNRSKINDNSKLNKNIYILNDKCDLHINLNISNSSFLEDSKNVIDGQKCSLPIYNKIINNNKFRKPINNKLKLNPLRLGQLKAIFFPNIQFTPLNKNKSFCLPNKMSLIRFGI